MSKLELENSIASVLEEISQYDSDKIIIAYPGNGQPIIKREENALYFFVNEVEGIGDFFNREFRSNGTVISQGTDTFELHLAAYGPNSYDMLHELLFDWYSPKAKILLDKEKIYTIPNSTEGPNIMSENYNGQWWERYDGSVRFYTPHTSVTDVNILTSAKIQIIKEDNSQ